MTEPQFVNLRLDAKYLPKGYRATGEIRIPETGETFLGQDGRTITAGPGAVCGPRIIIKPIPPKYRPAEPRDIGQPVLVSDSERRFDTIDWGLRDRPQVELLAVLREGQIYRYVSTHIHDARLNSVWRHAAVCVDTEEELEDIHLRVVEKRFVVELSSQQHQLLINWIQTDDLTSLENAGARNVEIRPGLSQVSFSANDDDTAYQVLGRLRELLVKLVNRK